MLRDPEICTDEECIDSLDHHVDTKSDDRPRTKRGSTHPNDSERSKRDRDEARLACAELKSKLHRERDPKPPKRSHDAGDERESRDERREPQRPESWTGSGAWHGEQPTHWTRQRSENIRAKSKFTRLRNSRALPAMDRCMLGPNYAELVIAGKLHPYPLEQRKGRRGAELPDGVRLRDHHVLALGHMITATLATGNDCLIISHLTMGGLLDGRSARRTGDTIRELVTWNFLEVEPWFTTEGKVLRLSSGYRVTAFALAYFGVRTWTLGTRARARRAARASLGQNVQAEVLDLRSNPEKEVSGGVDAPDVDSVEPVESPVLASEASRVETRSAPAEAPEKAEQRPSHCASERTRIRVSSVRSRELSRAIASDPELQKLRADARAAERAAQAALLAAQAHTRRAEAEHERAKQARAEARRQPPPVVAAAPMAAAAENQRELEAAKQRTDAFLENAATQLGRAPSSIPGLQARRCTCVVNRAGQVIELCASCADRPRGGRS